MQLHTAARDMDGQRCLPRAFTDAVGSLGWMDLGWWLMQMEMLVEIGRRRRYVTPRARYQQTGRAEHFSDLFPPRFCLISVECVGIITRSIAISMYEKFL